MSFKTNTGLNKPMAISYHDQMYEQWRSDPLTVDASWAKHFGGDQSSESSEISMILTALQQGGVRSAGGDITKAQADGQKLMQYIRAFMTHGHLKADVDPLKLD
jgi:2-oxoglutarate dehydrogenase complex dehydrogenase (E1) component-like enzyme